MKIRSAFTMIELIFVIVIMGILAKFGVAFLAQAYKSFLYETTNHSLQSKSAATVELIAKRLQYRIKDSVIARTAAGATPIAIGSASGETYTVLEWIGVANENFRGTTTPDWSGIIDLDNSNASVLTSPDTNTTALSSMILNLSENNATVADAALYFIGADSDIKTDYGWDGNLTKINAQAGAIHPITSTAQVNQFQSSTGTPFTGTDIYEYYKLAWTAYAVVMEDYNTTSHLGNLVLYYNYQPWQGENFNSGKSTTIMENISTFKFISIGSIIKIQVCAKSNILTNNGGDYSLCKEKTIF